jgi:hypothetical protein
MLVYVYDNNKPFDSFTGRSSSTPVHHIICDQFETNCELRLSTNLSVSAHQEFRNISRVMNAVTTSLSRF